MSEPMKVDPAAMARITARVRAGHQAVVAQAQSVGGFHASAGCSGRDYAAAGSRYVSLMRTNVIQSLQEFGTEVDLIATNLEATYRAYANNEKTTTQRIRPPWD